ncbi:hypothetical protein BH24ACT22_BH24ACT22_15320 [soil metagenome]
MPEQREHIEKALHECAGLGVPDTDLWPEIRERVSVAPQLSTRRFRLAPRTRLGWALMALLMLLFSTGAYAASGLVYETFVGELPGADGPVFGKEINLDQKQTESGARVSLEWVYADSSFVVVGYTVEDLKKNRRVAGHPVDLKPTDVIYEPGYEQQVAKEFPKRVKLTDEGGKRFRATDGGGMMSAGPDEKMDGPYVNTTVFTASERLNAGKSHSFRLEIPLQAYPLVSQGEKELPTVPVGDPFVFDFEVPVLPAPIIEIGQKVEANGVTLTLEKVVNSPGKPQAVVCIQPPDDQHQWELGENVRMGGRLWFTYRFDGGLEYSPLSAENSGYVGGMSAKEKQCYAVEMRPDRSGNYSFMVDSLAGWPRDQQADASGDVKTIRGPWKFTFEVPEQ